MNQFGKVAALVAGLAFGSVVYAARTEMGKTGLYVTLPSDVQPQTRPLSNLFAFVGKGNDDLIFAVQVVKNPVYNGVDVSNSAVSKNIDISVERRMANVQMLKKGVLTINKVKFKEYQMVDSSGTKMYSYMLLTVKDSSLVTISVASTLNTLEKNRQRIGDIVGSISTKP